MLSGLSVSLRPPDVMYPAYLSAIVLNVLQFFGSLSRACVELRSHL